MAASQYCSRLWAGRRISDHCLNVEQAEPDQRDYAYRRCRFVRITSDAGLSRLFLIRKGCDIGFNFVIPEVR